MKNQIRVRGKSLKAAGALVWRRRRARSAKRIRRRTRPEWQKFRASLIRTKGGRRTLHTANFAHSRRENKFNKRRARSKKQTRAEMEQKHEIIYTYATFHQALVSNYSCSFGKRAFNQNSATMRELKIPARIVIETGLARTKVLFPSRVRRAEGIKLITCK